MGTAPVSMMAAKSEVKGTVRRPCWRSTTPASNPRTEPRKEAVLSSMSHAARTGEDVLSVAEGKRWAQRELAGGAAALEADLELELELDLMEEVHAAAPRRRRRMCARRMASDMARSGTVAFGV